MNKKLAAALFLFLSLCAFAGDGYDKDNDLHKAGVPDSIIKRLKFN